MATLGQLAAELKPWFPGIDPLACLPFVQRAYRDIMLRRDWSFNKQNGAWFAPNQITSGTVTATQFSATVIADSVATPFWEAIALPAQPQSPMTLRQFRLTGNPLYNIVGYDGASTITLNRPMAEQGGSLLSYSIYQPYMPAPSPDFKRWMSIVDPISGYRFRYRNMFRTQKELDRRDPQRTSYGWPTWVATKDYVVTPGNTYASPRFEMGLGSPIQAIGYVLEYMTHGIAQITGAFAPNFVLPYQISDETVMARARYYGHDMMSNQPNVPIKEKALHLQKMRTMEAQYADLVRRDQSTDNQIFDSLVTDEQDGPDLSGPLDADYMQDHVLYWTV